MGFLIFICSFIYFSVSLFTYFHGTFTVLDIVSVLVDVFVGVKINYITDGLGSLRPTVSLCLRLTPGTHVARSAHSTGSNLDALPWTFEESV